MGQSQTLWNGNRTFAAVHRRCGSKRDEMSRTRVVGLGQAHIEHIAVTDRYPDADTTVDLPEFSIQGGGRVATALAIVASWGLEAALLGRLSDDEFGRFTVNSLAPLGVDTSGVRMQPGRMSPYRLVILDRSTHRATTLYTPGSIDPLALQEIDFAAIEQARLLLLDGSDPVTQLAAAQRARGTQVPVMLDVGRSSEEVLPLIQQTDVLIASERAILDLAPHAEIEDSLAELSRMGPSTVLVTMGAEGSIGLQGHKLVRQPPLDVEIVDTTGAGDVYLGAFCYGLVKEHALERCMRIASIGAGLSCRGLGSRSALPTLAEVEAMI